MFVLLALLLSLSVQGEAKSDVNPDDCEKCGPTRVSRAEYSNLFDMFSKYDFY